ncbi:peptidylprolyl isomerase [Pelagerythrobacter rhizovicinus]|uniref:Parvulin-like PPIase n=1 Tax=Pelagerythrobacter rhizovicinus TaxID=2268576 RepID=A0A4Q2KK54_9SPHN|nr:peptidylprolyl isomerase [Pelagerythrobacter rhizovicinus]RXZ65645.1 peptidylprolyl isomerase [Pelagerythrobacter rhizovicinus]
MIEYKFSKLLAGIAALGLAAGPVALQAQAANPLNIPEDAAFLGEGDPNVRTATAVVNGSVITGTDIEQRVALLLGASGNELSPEQLQAARMQILRNLIDETLQIQAATAQEMPVTDQEVEAQYAEIAQRNGQSVEGMNQALVAMGSSPASLKRQLRAEIAWQRLLSRNVAPFINVSHEEVTDVLARMEADRGTMEYRIGEIYLEATPENREAVLQNATRIVEQLQRGADFSVYARQFSDASTAAAGGDLGFVRLETLPDEMAAVAREMEPGQLVGPFEIPGGFEILYLIDRRQVGMADPRNAVLSLKQISIAFPADTTEAQAAARVEQFNTAIAGMRGCGDAERVASEIGAEVVTNNGMRVAQLPQQLQQTILNLQVGQSTPPFGSIDDGVRVLLLCGRDDPQTEGSPSFDRIMSQIEDDRIAKRAQSYLRDLRNDAFIEYN